MRMIKACPAVIAAVLMTFSVAASPRASDAPSPSDPALVGRGSYLARAGDCEACHTRPGGAPYAGGEAINSPFGALYAPNLTPDAVHGIGAWSDDDFYRAMHEGVGRQGQNLYPAFPYQWFTKVTRDDVLAIRAFLKTVAPSSEASKPNRMMFPFDVRAGLGPWNALYFHPGEYKQDPAKSEAWNRGAYLVEGLGHCSDCHTPKGLAMESQTSKAYSGGAIDNWYAPNITSDPAQGIGRWSADELAQYFKTGATRGKGVVVGPMAQVVHDSLSHLSDGDLQAIAAYVKTIPPLESYKADRPSGEVGPHPSGENVYVEHCSFCHQLNGQGRPDAMPALAGNGAVQAKGPEDVIRVILGGHLATGTFAPMPPVGAAMTDQEIADVTDYVRTAWSNAAPVIQKTGLVANIRAKMVSGLSGPGAREDNNDPCLIGPNSTPVPWIDDPQIDKTIADIKPDSMQQIIPSLIARVKQVSPDKPQADIINGLTLAYCRIEARTPDFLKPHGRDQLNRFGQLVYSELASKGHE
jgi:mono/diheme cytochrome c family protein